MTGVYSVCVCECMCVCMCVCVCMCECVYVCMCVCGLVYTSVAADDSLCVVFGGRHEAKKNKCLLYATCSTFSSNYPTNAPPPATRSICHYDQRMLTTHSPR